MAWPWTSIGSEEEPFMGQDRNRFWRPAIPIALVLLLILATFGLRLLYLTRISLYIDEFT